MINPLKKVEVNHFTLRHPQVDDRTRGMVVAHVTDIHHGRWVKSDHVRQLASWVSAQRPDLTVLTGDYVGYSAQDIEPCAQALRALEGPVYATLGNHDHWASTERTWEAFEQAKIPVLTNTSEIVETRGGHALRVIGVDDAVTKNHDLDQAFSQACGRYFQLALCHVPELAPKVAQRGGHLILSGHTHGLQFNIPRVTERLANRLGVNYVGGAYEVEESLLYVSRGLGSASWPWRFRAAPELAFFRLEAGDRPSLSLDRSHHVEIQGPQPRAGWPRRRRQGQHGAAALVLGATLATGASHQSCQKDAPEAALSWHAQVKIKEPISKVEAVCQGKRCKLTHALVESIGYEPDDAGRIRAVLVRFRLPPQPSVQASQNLFLKIKGELEAGLGPSETFLASGDPCYWPARATHERVVTLTIDREERTILALGAAGPEADKIPTGGVANDLREVQLWWDKVLPLLEKKP